MGLIGHDMTHRVVVRTLSLSVAFCVHVGVWVGLARTVCIRHILDQVPV